MSRRRSKKTSPAEDFISLIALMPWWAGVLAAVVFYLVLHQMAQQTVVIGKQPDIGRVMTQNLWKALATFGQYVLPLLCLAGAAASAWKRHTRKTLAANVTANPAADALDGMSWQQFEILVGEAFRQQGFSVFENGGGGADGGVDLVLRKGTEKFLVQCKQWKAYKVGVDVVRELYGVMAAQGAAGGFVVTSGRFTDEARLFASGRNVRLVDGAKLRELLAQTRQTLAEAPMPVTQRATPRPEPKPASASVRKPMPAMPTSAPRNSGLPATAPQCPVCTKEMVRRKARQGANAGREFWGCVGYPACRGTRAG